MQKKRETFKQLLQAACAIVKFAFEIPTKVLQLRKRFVELPNGETFDWNVRGRGEVCSCFFSVSDKNTLLFIVIYRVYSECNLGN